jgi:hypothetical protein
MPEAETAICRPEDVPFNPQVVGSNPTGPIKLSPNPVRVADFSQIPDEVADSFSDPCMTAVF